MAMLGWGLVTTWLYWSVNAVVVWMFGVSCLLVLASLSKAIYVEASKTLERIELEHRASLVRDSLSSSADTSMPPKITEAKP